MRPCRVCFAAKCTWLPSSPESRTAQTMPSPSAWNERCAASAFTVVSDLVSVTLISLSSQMRYTTASSRRFCALSSWDSSASFLMRSADRRPKT